MNSEQLESKSIEESSEILLVVSKNLDSITAQYIKDNVTKIRAKINAIEIVMGEKKELLKNSSDKLCDLDRRIGEIEIETEHFMQHKKTQIELYDIESKKKLYV